MLLSVDWMSINLEILTSGSELFYKIFFYFIHIELNYIAGFFLRLQHTRSRNVLYQCYGQKGTNLELLRPLSKLKFCSQKLSWYDIMLMHLLFTWGWQDMPGITRFGMDHGIWPYPTFPWLTCGSKSFSFKWSFESKVWLCLQCQYQTAGGQTH